MHLSGFRNDTPPDSFLRGGNSCECFPAGGSSSSRRTVPARGVLALALALFIFGLLSGQIGPPAWNWVEVSLVLTSGVGLFIAATVPDHFLEEHLWEHTAKIHVPRLFLWTFGARLVTPWVLMAASGGC